MAKSSSAERYRLRDGFLAVRNVLLDERFADRLDRSLGYWALPADRRLPVALMDRTLRDIVATPFERLAATPGIGQRKLNSLIVDAPRHGRTLRRRLAASLVADDVYVNVAGGMTIDEPAADLAVVAAVASRVRNRALRPRTVAFGEVGLGGEVRGVPQTALRLREAAQLGFGRAVIPEGSGGAAETPPSLEVVRARTVADAMEELLGW